MSEPAAPAVPTARLHLVALPLPVLEALLVRNLTGAAELIEFPLPAGWPDARDDFVLGLRRDQLRADPTELPWLLRAMVRRQPVPTMVGRIGFHAPPDRNGMVEIGYTVLAAYRRQGYAREAVTALLGWAAAQPGVRRLRASVGPDNTASRALLGSLGFVQIGTQWDDRDGEELVLERPP